MNIKYYRFKIYWLLTLCPLVFTFCHANQFDSVKNQYSPDFIVFLHSLYGEGNLAEGCLESNKLLVMNLNLHNTKCLDFGCGTGGVTSFISDNFPDSYVIGLDVAESCINIAQNKFPKNRFSNIDFIAYHPPRLPFPDNTFDFVFAKEVFIHISNKKETLDEIQRILKPGGKLVIIDWFSHSESNEKHSDGDLINVANIDLFSTMLTNANFNYCSQELTAQYKKFLQETLDKISTVQSKPFAGDYHESLTAILNNLDIQKTAVVRFQATSLKP